ncbi:ABA4-like family protein [Sphingomicrobium lutaoense]|uniref:DUF4281 domain-containing protein n=1 Tax=Sphingomicrobium lutaoense TaxID=515949 RepID=A0A839Z1L8_9SPHN|nr:ABA4-like family protein [Sphingomicrobium lutaoense]MBB3763947.1 hypothetical protein [Sphingomicrobium lutaoense]
MDWGLLFGAVNIIALIGWGLLFVARRGPLLHSTILYLGVTLLSAIYAAAFAGLLLTDGLGEGGFGSIADIRALFASDAGIVIGWTHYLAFDLFVGLWIAREADQRGFSRLAQVPVLALTLMAGPAGLLLWMLLRGRKKIRRG